MSGYLPDTRRLAAQACERSPRVRRRAVGYELEDRNVPAWQVGLVLGAIVAGTALMSVLVARYADRVGRRRWYAGLYLCSARWGWCSRSPGRCMAAGARR